MPYQAGRLKIPDLDDGRSAKAAGASGPTDALAAPRTGPRVFLIEAVDHEAAARHQADVRLALQQAGRKGRRNRSIARRNVARRQPWRVL